MVSLLMFVCIFQISTPKPYTMEILFFVLFVAVFVFVSVMNKRNRAQKIAQQAKNKTDAQALNMDVSSSVGSTNKNNFLAEDDYSGTTGDIPWTLVSKEININDTRGNHGGGWKRTTIWNTREVKMQE